MSLGFNVVTLHGISCQKMYGTHSTIYMVTFLPEGVSPFPNIHRVVEKMCMSVKYRVCKHITFLYNS